MSDEGEWPAEPTLHFDSPLPTPHSPLPTPHSSLSRAPDPSGSHRVAGQALQDGDGGRLGEGQAAAADDEGLLQGVLAADAGMAGGVGEDDPGGAGRELPALFGAIALELGAL